MAWFSCSPFNKIENGESGIQVNVIKNIVATNMQLAATAIIFISVPAKKKFLSFVVVWYN